MGEDIVAWIDDDGCVCIADAYCPHLGADLGPVSGGRMCEGRLVCPFHGYEFDATGQCVATPFAEPPKTAKLRVFETQEVLGMILLGGGSGDGNRNVASPQKCQIKPAGPTSTSKPAASRPSLGDNGERSGFGPPALRPRLRQRGPRRAGVG